jgi:hypothetical protein
MPRHLSYLHITHLSLAAVLVLALGVPAVGQIAEPAFRQLIGVSAWTSDELKAIDAGEAVVRSIETGNKQEIATLAVMRLPGLADVSMQAFRQSLSQKRSDSVKAGGRFSEPAMVTDLSDLVLDDAAIRELEECSVRRCDLNLSGKMIARFREIDWNSPDAKERAENLFREMLVDHVSRYRISGDRSLGTYDNRRETVDLSASHRALLSNSLLVDQLAPEFIRYLRDYPAAELENVENSIGWSVVDFGLKPSITVSHQTAYTQTNGSAQQLYLASKQIFSSRYLDSSLAFTMLLRVAAGNAADTYLVFVDRSRSDVLKGALGGFARKMVAQKASDRAAAYCKETRLRLLAAVNVRTAESSSTQTDDAVFGINKGVFLLLLAAAAAIAAFWFRKRRHV